MRPIEEAAEEAAGLVKDVAASAAEAAAKRVHQASAAAAVQEWAEQERRAEMIENDEERVRIEDRRGMEGYGGDLMEAVKER